MSDISDPERTVLNGFTISYDPEHGEVVEKFNGDIQQILTVRASMLETIVRQAAIVELEKLGYTVIPPDTPEDQQQ